jgi:hypothetical protein
MIILWANRNLAKETELNRCSHLLPTISLRLRIARKRNLMKIEEALSHKEESCLRSLTQCCLEVREPKMNKVPQMLAPIMK